MNCSPSSIALNSQAVLLAFFLVNVLFVGPADCDQTNAAVWVNQTAITQVDIEYKVRVERAYENQKASIEAACVSLVNDAIEHEIAIMNGVTVTQKEINAFKRHVEHSTRAPKILKRIKRVFANDTLAYERIYLAPKIINRKLHDYYRRNKKIHQSEATRINHAYKLLLSGKSFADAADETGLQYATFEINKPAAVDPQSTRDYIQDHKKDQLPPLLPRIERLSDGDMAKEIIEDNYSYRIIRRLQEKKSNFIVESITVNKQPFDAWYKKKATKIRIAFQDRDLYRSISRIYPNMWWKNMITDIQ